MIIRDIIGKLKRRLSRNAKKNEKIEEDLLRDREANFAMMRANSNTSANLDMKIRRK